MILTEWINIVLLILFILNFLIAIVSLIGLYALCLKPKLKE